MGKLAELDESKRRSLQIMHALSESSSLWLFSVLHCHTQWRSRWYTFSQPPWTGQMATQTADITIKTKLVGRPFVRRAPWVIASDGQSIIITNPRNQEIAILMLSCRLYWNSWVSCPPLREFSSTEHYTLWGELPLHLHLGDLGPPKAGKWPHPIGLNLLVICITTSAP